MSLLAAWLLRTKKRPGTSAPAGRRRTFFEPLEPRLAPANLGLGIYLLADKGGVPDTSAQLTQVTTGQPFWIEVIAEDKRSKPAPGVISLPLNLSWDSSTLTLLSTLTPN